MTYQGRNRLTPPFCHGNGNNLDGNEHCCYVDGQVCKFLETDAAPDRKYSCGIWRNLAAKTPPLGVKQVWDQVHDHDAYLEVRLAFQRSGTMLCGGFLGTWLPDGTIEGQCCFAGYVFDSAGNVISGP